MKKRGVKSAPPPSPPDKFTSAPLPQVTSAAGAETSGKLWPSTSTSTAGNFVSFPLHPTQQAMVLANESIIVDLVKVYIEVVYPIFPLFHRKTMLHKVIHRYYLDDRALFAGVMTICAMASARARDGALFPGRWDPSHFQEPTSEAFFAVAKDCIPRDLGDARGLDYMRACALLALVGIQYGRIDVMHQYLGLYHSLVVLDGLHDETRWPPGLGIVEIEERRRLFWSMYTLEVYASIIWGGVIRCREAQSRVCYPSEVDDDFFSESGFDILLPAVRTGQKNVAISSSSPIRDRSSWLHGWNFTTDMYRVLEHAMDDFHSRRSQDTGPFRPSELFGQDAPPQSVVLDKVMSMHAQLPLRFKETRNVLSEAEDRFSFQAANIAATLQLVRMVLFTAEDATVDQKCAIARDLLDRFAEVPVLFLRAISSPLLHHLAGIGSILGSVIEGPLSESSYLQVRAVLLAMADLLSNLEVPLSRTTGTKDLLYNLVARIDTFLQTQRQHEPPTSTSVLAMLAPASNERTSAPVPPSPPVQHLEPYQQQHYAAYSDPEPYGTANEEMLRVQLPPELLESWPWPFDFDFTQGFPGYMQADWSSINLMATNAVNASVT